MPIVYEVAAEVDAERVAAYERFQRERHIPDVMRSGCFVSASLERGDAPGRYRVRYVADSAADTERYVRDHAPALREDFLRHFPTGVRLSRALWEVVEEWTRPASP